MVKGLAKLWNRLRHGLCTKCVDASPFMDEGRLLPNDGRHYSISIQQVYCCDSACLVRSMARPLRLPLGIFMSSRPFRFRPCLLNQKRFSKSIELIKIQQSIEAASYISLSLGE
jgi:hypothetical protein